MPAKILNAPRTRNKHSTIIDGVDPLNMNMKIMDRITSITPIRIFI
jgi:hypothetical protein